RWRDFATAFNCISTQDPTCSVHLLLYCDRYSRRTNLQADSLLQSMKAKHDAAIILHHVVVRPAYDGDAGGARNVVAAEVRQVVEVEHVAAALYLRNSDI